MKMIVVLQQSHFQPRRRNIVQANETQMSYEVFRAFFASKKRCFCAQNFALLCPIMRKHVEA
jgi:hypothetical protein